MKHKLTATLITAAMLIGVTPAIGSASVTHATGEKECTITAVNGPSTRDGVNINFIVGETIVHTLEDVEREPHQVTPATFRFTAEGDITIEETFHPNSVNSTFECRNLPVVEQPVVEPAPELPEPEVEETEIIVPEPEVEQPTVEEPIVEEPVIEEPVIEAPQLVIPEALPAQPVTGAPVYAG